MSVSRIVSTLLLSLGAAAAEPAVAPAQMPRVPPTEAHRAAATFALRSGFRAELVAAEPLVTSPVAVTVDERGRAFVVEMRDYSERRPEQLGRIKLLEDTDGDGRYDKATVFLANLPWPTAITCWNGGVFIGATPDIIYAKDTDGDGVADVREVVFTGFASDYAPYATNKLNVQALMNSFQWGLDCRIHGATSMSGGKVRMVDSEFTQAWREREERLVQRPPSPRPSPPGRGGNKTSPLVQAPGSSGGQAQANRSPSPGGEGRGEGGPAPRSANLLDLRGRDFSFDPRTLELRPETGGGQHGMSFDNGGRKFVCSNSDHLQLIAFDAESVAANPFHELPAARVSIAADGPSAEVFRRSPDEPWRVLRTRWRVAGLVEGPVEGGGRPSGYFTGATGVTIYRGDAYGSDFAGDAFIADCGSNLVHRKKLRSAPDGILLIGERAADEQKSEFLASTDNWFRPVQFYNAPDGCLWVVDMYRETIEHPWSLPANLKQNLDLDSGRERGRLWRLKPAALEVQGSRFKVQSSDTTALVALLSHPNGWHRDTAARLLVERADLSAVPALKALLGTSPNPLARLHALNVLAALDGLDETTLAALLVDTAAVVRRDAAHRSSAAVSTASAGVRAALEGIASLETDPLVRLELALAEGRRQPVSLVSLEKLFRTGPPLVRSAAIHSATGLELSLWHSLTDILPAPPFDSGASIAELAQVIGRRGIGPEIQAVLAWVQRFQGSPLAAEVARALAKGLAMERRAPLVAALPGPLPEAFAHAWGAATNPPPKPKPFALVPPNPDRLAVLEQFLPALDLVGDPKRGAALFRERCITCHAFRGEGTALGPDLASVVANGPNKLLVSILDPNREVAPNFAAWTAEPKDAEPVTGLLARESDGSLTLRLAGGTETTLSKAQLKSWKTEGRSLMPEGLESGLSHADVAGLLAWLTLSANNTPP